MSVEDSVVEPAADLRDESRGYRLSLAGIGTNTLVKAMILSGFRASSESCIVPVFYEHQVLGLSSGVLVSTDTSGFRSVVAPPDLRERVASVATEALLEQRAQIVLCSCLQETPDCAAASGAFGHSGTANRRWTRVDREVTGGLSLEPTYDATLARLGKRTRHHLRLFRKLIEGHVDCEYLPDITGLVAAAEWPGINAASLNPLPQRRFEQQWQACAGMSGGFTSGLRTKQGQWLSIIGGWRQDGTTTLAWQMNTAGYERFL